jgi:phosphatidylethanolamine-binding protein (PEBP) family uncharacterized protein
MLPKKFAGANPLGVAHWLACDIPGTKTGLKEGEASAPSSEFKGGKSTVNQQVYFGPARRSATSRIPISLH